MSKASECPWCGFSLEGEPHSDAQRNYYRGPVLGALTDYYNRESNLPLPVHKSYVHERMLEAFLGLDDEGKLRRSRKLTSKQYAKMTDDVRNFLATKGVLVPGPNDPWEENQ